MDGRGKVFFDEAKQSLRMIGINVDITQRKQPKRSVTGCWPASAPRVLKPNSPADSKTIS